MPTSTLDENTQDYVGAGVHHGSASGLVDVVGAYQPPRWNAGWREAVSNAGATAAELVVIGDSVAQGQPGDANNDRSDNPQDWLNQSMYGYLRDDLKQVVPGGLGAQWFGSQESQLRNFEYHDGLNGTTPSAPIVFNDGVLGGTAFYDASTLVHGSTSINRNGWWYSPFSTVTTDWTDANTWMVKFTPPSTDVVAVDAVYANYNGTNNGSFYYDSTAAGTTKTSTGAIPLVTSGGYETHKTRVWSGAASQPTIYLGKQSNSTTLQLLGFISYRATAGGLRTARHAYTGNTSVLFSDTSGGGSGFPTDRIKQMVGGFNGTNYNAVGFPTAPHLLIFMLGINDCNKTQAATTGWNGGPSTYAAVVRRCIEAGRRARDAMSVLVLMPFYPPITYSDSGGFAHNDSWPRYRQAVQPVCEEYGAALLSVNARWGSQPLARGFVVSGDGHPAAAGYRDMATFVGQVL